MNSHAYCEQGEVVKDPFRRGIGNAVQWYDSLQSLLAEQVENALKTADEIVTTIKTTHGRPPPPSDPALPSSTSIKTAHVGPSPDPSLRAALPSSTDGQALPPSPSNVFLSPLTARRECARILQQRCPACFALTSFSRPSEQ